MDGLTGRGGLVVLAGKPTARKHCVNMMKHQGSKLVAEPARAGLPQWTVLERCDANEETVHG